MGGSSPSGSTTTTQNSSPWVGQQGSISNLLSNAGSIYANNPALQYYPGQAYAPLTGGQQQQIGGITNFGAGGGSMPGTVAGLLQNVASNNPYGQNPGNAGYESASGYYDPYAAQGGGFGTSEIGTQASPMMRGLENFAAAPGAGTGAARQLQGMAQGPGAGTGAAQGLQGMAQGPGAGTGAAQGLLGMASGPGAGTGDASALGQIGTGPGASSNAESLLQPIAAGANVNPNASFIQNYLHAADQPTLGAVASQFEAGGRYGSDNMAETTGQTIGNLNANILGQIIPQEQALQGQAQSTLGSLEQGDTAQQIAALQAGGGLQQGAAGLQQQAFGTAGGLQQGAAGLQTQQLQGAGALQQGAAGLQTQQLQGAGALQQGAAGQQLSALTNAGQLGTAQESNALQGILGAGGLSQGAAQTRLGGAQGLASNYNTGLQQMLQTGLLAPGVNNAQMNNLQSALQAQTAEQQNQQNIDQAAMQKYMYNQSSPYNTAAMYQGLIQGNYGGQGSTKQPYFQNPTANIMGYGSGLESMAMTGLLGAALL